MSPSVRLERRRATHRRVALIATTVLVLAVGLLPTPGLFTQLVLVAGAVLLAGLPHGALDAVVGMRGRGGVSPTFFVLVYVGLMAATVAVWIASPPAALVGFLLLSMLHFGRGDVPQGATGGETQLEVIIRGAAPILLPAWFWPGEVSLLFGWLTAVPVDEMERVVRSVAPTLGAGWVAAALAQGIGSLLDRRPVRPWLESQGEMLVLFLAFLVLPPLLSFALYFGLWHSARHLIALDTLLGVRDGLNRALLIRRALPVLAATLVLGAAAYWQLSLEPIDLRALVQTLFVGLAALTVPHMAVTLLVDRAFARSRNPAVN